MRISLCFMENADLTYGTQSLRRTLQVLRLLGDHYREGLRMTDVARLAGLERSTAHRLLACLAEEQFAEKDEKTKRYRLGIESMHLGVAAARKMPLVENFRPTMLRLARMSGDTVFLVARVGDETICLHREEGPYPVKVHTLNVGDRSLLGLGCGGLAIMATLEDAEINGIIARNKERYYAAGRDTVALWRSIRTTRQTGYSQLIGPTVPEVAVIGTVVPLASHVQVGMSIGTITPRFGLARRSELARLLKSAMAELGASKG